ncbi:MAG: hypothetical protein KBG15_13430 [Kofleriaceae bacterium]|nr:hypothetical protein [Kofleriaceae bacterium]
MPGRIRDDGYMFKWSAAFAIASALHFTAPTVAWARSERTFGYSAATVFGTAVRFLRVNEAVKIIEKDADAGYILFELIDGKRSFRGSIEVLAVEKDGRNMVRFVIQIADQPSYIEIAMMERLERKLRDELGTPNSTPTKPAPSKVPAEQPSTANNP